MGINRVELSGNLTRDPEVRTTPSGMPVMNLGLAVNDRRKSQQTGEWEDRPNFVDCVMFGERAGKVALYLAKGAKVAIAGRLSWSQWQDRETGKNRSKLEVVIEDIEFMSRDGQAVAHGAPQTPQNAAYAAQPSQPAYAPVQQQPAPYVAAGAPQQGHAQPQQPAFAGAGWASEDIPF